MADSLRWWGGSAAECSPSPLSEPLHPPSTIGAQLGVVWPRALAAAKPSLALPAPACLSEAGLAQESSEKLTSSQLNTVSSPDNAVKATRCLQKKGEKSSELAQLMKCHDLKLTDGRNWVSVNTACNSTNFRFGNCSASLYAMHMLFPVLAGSGCSTTPSPAPAAQPN